MTNSPVELRIIEGLESSFQEYLDNFDYWLDYQITLDNLYSKFQNEKLEYFIRHMNFMLDNHPSYTAKYHAYSDVALCFEENEPEKYKSKFKY